MATTTSIAGLPIPQQTDSPDVPRDISNLAVALEKRLVVVYASVADRSAKNPTPQEGMFGWLSDLNRMEVYQDGAWVTYPAPQVSITSGTTVPSNATGNNGDVFFKI